jgi:hypothetical protein
MLRDLVHGHRTIKRWFAARRFRRGFRVAPTFAIETLPEDTVGRIAGPVQPHAASFLLSPVTARRCVLYVVEIYEHPFHGDFPSKLVLTERDAVPFVVEQDGHRALVDPTDAQISLGFDHTANAYESYDDEHQKALLARHAMLPPRKSDQRHLEYREAVLELGEVASILGSGTREPDPDAPPDMYRATSRTRLRLTSSAKYPLAITDDPKCV